uniref:FecR family protein n=1 Tax=uncultured Draconibacterium sp. TaxID=1573823 RepID=UPI00321681B9
MTKETIIKFLNNRCTEAELEEIIQWAKTEAFTKESLDLGYNDRKSFRVEEDSEEDEKFRSLFDKIQHKIDTKITEDRIIDERKTKLSIFTSWMTRAAAILLIPVLAFLFYTLSEKKLYYEKYTAAAVDSLEIIAPVGSRTVVQLSDGSQVHLNYGSKIKYPQFFSGNKREIILEGEGFFDVVRNPDKPFIVKTPILNVKALGTSFNVLAYRDKDVVETTLVSGKVVLEQNAKNGTIKTIGALVPGQHVDYNIETGAILSTKGNIAKYIAWKEGKLIFEDASIIQVAERLSRMFNVDIEVSDDIKDFIYTVTFLDEPLFQILDLMTIATPVSYKALPREKLQDGTFSKQKIVITRDTNIKINL